MAFEDNGSLVDPPKLSDKSNFPIWKNRMITFLNSIDTNLMETIKEGRNIPPLIINPGTNEALASKERREWNFENKHKTFLDSKAKQILSVSLPDDIYRLVMTCESAKEMWDQLIVLFEGTDETRGFIHRILVDEFLAFKYHKKPDESLTDLYIRFKCLLRDLKQHNITIENEAKVFLSSVPRAFGQAADIIRHESKKSKVVSLDYVYGILRAHELGMQNDKENQETYKAAEDWKSPSDDNGYNDLDFKLHVHGWKQNKEEVRK